MPRALTTARLKAHDRAKTTAIEGNTYMILWPLIHVKCSMNLWALSGTHSFSPFNPGEDWVVNTAATSKAGSDVCRVACGQRWKLRGYTREESCWSAPPLVLSLLSILYRFLLAGGSRRRWLFGLAGRALPVTFYPCFDSLFSMVASQPTLSFSRCSTKVAVTLICLPGQRWGMLSMCGARRRWNRRA